MKKVIRLVRHDSLQQGASEPESVTQSSRPSDASQPERSAALTEAEIEVVERAVAMMRLMHPGA